MELFREFITAEEVEIAGPGGDFDGLAVFAEGGFALASITNVSV